MEKVCKESVHYRLGDRERHCGNCVMFHLQGKYGLLDSGTCDLVRGVITVVDVCDRWEAKAEKSEQTPSLAATPAPLGNQGLWHTPDKHVPAKQKLPNYIEHIAQVLMKDQGMGESQAIATALNAVKRWAQGNLGERHGHVHPEVISASRAALAEWEKLKESHHQ